MTHRHLIQQQRIVTHSLNFTSITTLYTHTHYAPPHTHTHSANAEKTKTAHTSTKMYTKAHNKQPHNVNILY